ARVVGRHAVDLVDAEQCRVLLVARLRSREAAHVVALAERESTDLRRGDVHVFLAGQVAARAEEPVSLVAEVEEADDFDRLALDLARPRSATPLFLPAATTTAAPATAVAVTERLPLVLGVDADAARRRARGVDRAVVGRGRGRAALTLGAA